MQQQHKPPKMEPLETKEIRGLSLRALAWLIASTVTIVVFVITSYFLLKNLIETVNQRVDQIETVKRGDKEVLDLRLEVLRSDINRINAQIQNIQNQVNGNSAVIQQRQNK